MARSKKAGKKTGAMLEKKRTSPNVTKADWEQAFKKKQNGVSDMTLLPNFTNEGVNANLHKRWINGEIYTYIGDMLIIVNPFRDLGIHNHKVMAGYKGKNRLETAPHVYAIAEGAYYNMRAYHENQCVLISGESGAGKTEAAKHIMRYLVTRSSDQDSSIQEVEDMVLATIPLLESFGCAKTLRNNNSSRHGKYLELMFNERGETVGAQITNYFLHKDRVVGQIDGERNFHIFYQLTKAASEEQREMFGLQGPECYLYTSRSNCLSVPGIDDSTEMRETLKAMEVIGISTPNQIEIFRMLATILWIGNIQFDEMDDGNAKIADSGVTDFIAYLMDVDSSLVEKVLTQKVIETSQDGRRGSVHDVPLNPAQAVSRRDALSTAIYNNLFEYIMTHINKAMKPQTAHSHTIGILDIYGFEMFQDNSFEQLCINYVNEKLQQIFIELTLKAEQEEYVREHIKWTPIRYFNNKPVCDLIEERRPPGLFVALNNAAATAHSDPVAADKSFIQRSAVLSSNAHFESRGAQFLVKHYAGDVLYNVAGMTDKNKDAVTKDLLDLVASSGNAFLTSLFPDRPDSNSKKGPPTAVHRIKASVGALVDNFMKARPSLIRTIRPNGNQTATYYDNKIVLHQIKYLGLPEDIRLRRAGFVYRKTFMKMIERFYLLSPATSYAGDYIWKGDPIDGCRRILEDSGIAKKEWQLGDTKAFIKSPETVLALEMMRDRYWHNMAGRIQRAWRKHWRYKNECATRIQRFWKNSKERMVYAEMRELGDNVLAGRKERRRYSLLSYRQFFGDYLGVKNQNNALGETLRDVCGLEHERVLFSAQSQLLVSKRVRSSEPSPRYLILTDKAVYLVMTNNKDGKPVTHLDRKINLESIEGISMTNLRDDWMAIRGLASEDGDVVISCLFKTEFITHLMLATKRQIQVTIAPQIEYSRKKDKVSVIKAIKDESILRDDVYKNQTIHVPSGEPPNSISRLGSGKNNAGIIPIITEGFLREGEPSKDETPEHAVDLKPATRPLSAYTEPDPNPNSTLAVTSATSSRPPPPHPRRAPPPPPSAPAYKAVYAFKGQEGELTLAKGDMVELVEQDNNGWWLMKRDNEEGWVPYTYLELASPKDTPTPTPPHPSRRSATVPTTANTTFKPLVLRRPVEVVPNTSNRESMTSNRESMASNRESMTEASDHEGRLANFSVAGGKGRGKDTSVLQRIQGERASETGHDNNNNNNKHLSSDPQGTKRTTESLLLTQADVHAILRRTDAPGLPRLISAYRGHVRSYSAPTEIRVPDSPESAPVESVQIPVVTVVKPSPEVTTQVATNNNTSSAVSALGTIIQRVVPRGWTDRSRSNLHLPLHPNAALEDDSKIKYCEHGSTSSRNKIDVSEIALSIMAGMNLDDAPPPSYPDYGNYTKVMEHPPPSNQHNQQEYLRSYHYHKASSRREDGDKDNRDKDRLRASKSVASLFMKDAQKSKQDNGKDDTKASQTGQSDSSNP